MARRGFAAVPSRPVEGLDVTSLPLEAFEQRVPPVAVEFQAQMAAGRLDEKTADRPSICRRQKLPPADAGRPVVS